MAGSVVYACAGGLWSTTTYYVHEHHGGADTCGARVYVARLNTYPCIPLFHTRPVNVVVCIANLYVVRGRTIPGRREWNKLVSTLLYMVDNHEHY